MYLRKVINTARFYTVDIFSLFCNCFFYGKGLIHANLRYQKPKYSSFSPFSAVGGRNNYQIRLWNLNFNVNISGRSVQLDTYQVPKLELVELLFHFPISVQGMMLNELQGQFTFIFMEPGDSSPTSQKLGDLSILIVVSEKCK
jgi:hypothetical protein